LATRPNAVWSWDITKLLGPAKWTSFHRYVILDVFSRYVVGWLVGLRETAELAQDFIAETAAKQGIDPGTLTLHADRGSSMTAKPVAFLRADPGITQSHARPQVSNDNPYSESQCKMLKYRPRFPNRFLSIEGRGPSVGRSSAGTTRSIITAASACTRRRPCTMGWRRRGSASAAKPSTPPTRRIPRGSSPSRRPRQSSPPRPGSTSQRRRPERRVLP